MECVLHRPDNVVSHSINIGHGRQHPPLHTTSTTSSSPSSTAIPPRQSRYPHAHLTPLQCLAPKPPPNCPARCVHLASCRADYPVSLTVCASRLSRPGRLLRHLYIRNYSESRNPATTAMSECSGSPCSAEDQLDHLRQVVRACAIHHTRLDLNRRCSLSWLTPGSCPSPETSRL